MVQDLGLQKQRSKVSLWTYQVPQEALGLHFFFRTRRLGLGHSLVVCRVPWLGREGNRAGPELSFRDGCMFWQVSVRNTRKVPLTACTHMPAREGASIQAYLVSPYMRHSALCRHHQGGSKDPGGVCKRPLWGERASLRRQGAGKRPLPPLPAVLPRSRCQLRAPSQ